MINGKIYKEATISRVEADGIVLRTKTGIYKIYFVASQRHPGPFSLQSSDANRVQLDRTPTKAKVKQDDSRQTNESGWAGALPIAALFLRFLILEALTITGALVVIVRSRFQ